MILKALYDYYERKPEIHSPIGYELEELDFIIVIDRNGRFVDLQNKREEKHGKTYFVPKGIIRTGGVKSNFLWDKIEYVTGYSKDEKKSNKAIECNEAFVKKIELLPAELKEDEGIKAIQTFYESKQILELIKHQSWEECLKISGWISFQFDGETDLIANREVVKRYQENEFLSGSYEEDDLKKLQEGICLITGNKNIIKRLNSELRLPGSDKNVKIVAFQTDKGFDSYGKEQAYNAPISIIAENNYSAALKHLINSKTNKKIVADTTILFWSERKAEETVHEEEAMAWLIAAQKADEDNPDKGVHIIESFINSVYDGKYSSARTNHFYVLGLSPNAARISVRFWKTPSIEDFGKNIKQHFDDFEIVHGPNEVKYLSLYQILSSTALGYKMDNVPPNIVGSVIESIIDGTLYPSSLLQQCIRRIRAEQSVNRSRAAIIKAYFNRHNRIHITINKEITMGLDSNNLNPAYRTGRLFGVLEKIQEEANPGINATIRDRYYGAASSCPITVFPRLLGLKNSHLKKLSNGREVYFEKLIGEILYEIKMFPKNLSLNDQAYFAIGYYHQRQDFYTKKLDKKDNTNESI